MSNLDLFEDNTQVVELHTQPVAQENAPMAVDDHAHATDETGEQTKALETRFSPEARKWALAVLEVVAGSGDRKTVLKKLKDQPEAMEELLQACLVIALRKAQSYARRLSAAQATEALNGWVLRDPDLAHATGVFNRVLFDISEVPLMPAALIGD
jgi:hypothetical protein